MEILAICRICLSDKVQHVVKHPQLREMYENLTTIPFQSEMRPLAVCYICYAQLRASLRFKLKCLRAEQLLAEMLDQQRAGDKVVDGSWVDRSPLNQLSICVVDHGGFDSTIHDDHMNKKEAKLTYEYEVKLEEATTTDLPDTGRTAHSRPDSEQGPSNSGNSVPWKNIEIKIEQEEVSDGEKDEHYVIVSPKTEECESTPVDNYKQGIINVTNTDDVGQGASEHNDAVENDRIKMSIEQNLATIINMRQQYNVPQYYHNKKKIITDNITLYNNHNLGESGFGSDKILICDNCKKIFCKKSDLVKHKLMRICEKTYICSVCDKVCATKYYLKIHARSHTGEKPYVCNVCEKGFTHRSHLNSHSVTHTGEKPYVCDVCQKGFSQSSHLRSHALTHTGEKPYVCNVCTKAFRLRAHLETHARTHTGEKPYVCNVCKKGFTDRSDLNKHSLTHSGVKPYVCDVCNRGFTQRSSLVRHRATHK